MPTIIIIIIVIITTSTSHVLFLTTLLLAQASRPCLPLLSQQSPSIQTYNTSLYKQSAWPPCISKRRYTMSSSAHSNQTNEISAKMLKFQDADFLDDPNSLTLHQKSVLREISEDLVATKDQPITPEDITNCLSGFRSLTDDIPEACALLKVCGCYRFSDALYR